MMMESTGASVDIDEVEGVKENGSQLSKRRNRNDNAYTGDGSLDRHGKPAIKAKTGRWPCAILVLVNQALCTLPFAAVEVNIALFSKSVLRQSNADSANTFSVWMGTVYLVSLFGAFLSDSYLGRYLTIITFEVILILGFIGLTLITQLSLINSPGCGTIGNVCKPHTQGEVILFHVAIYLIALGNGASEPAIATFGADQFDEEDPEENKSKTSFYSYFYVALNLGCLVAETIVVYLTNLGYWVWGFWICCGCAVVAFLFIFSGTLRYRHFKPSGNPISRFAQVIVASIKKAELKAPANEDGLYEIHEGESETKGVRRILHSNGFKCLDRAAIMTPEEVILVRANGQTPNPWQLCTVTQVEEVKCVLRLIPIWLCTILSSAVYTQMLSLFIEQGAAMHTRVGDIHIPPVSMTTFDIMSTTLFIVLYDKLIAPLYTKVTKKKPEPPSELKRIGFGLAIATLGMVAAGITEQQRLKHASPTAETSSLSIFCQVPQYVLVGISEAFVYVAQMELFASEMPDSMKSLGIGLSMSSSALGGYICSLFLSVVMAITSRNGQPGWVPPNLNHGHLDRFYFLSAGFTALNLGLYIFCAKRYKSKSVEKKEEGTRTEIVP